MEIKAENLMRIVDVVRHMGTPTRAKIFSEKVYIRLNTGTELHFNTSEIPGKKREIMEPVLKQAFRGIRIEAGTRAGRRGSGVV